MKKLFAVVFFLTLLTPVVALAASPWQPFWGPILSCTGNYSFNGSQAVPNPTIALAPTKYCTSLCDLLVTGQNVVNFMLTLALYVGGPLALAIGGFLILISGGSEERVTAGRQVITSAAIGIGIVLFAFPALDTLFTVIGGTTGVAQVGWPLISCTPAANQITTPPPPECGATMGTCPALTNYSLSCVPAPNGGYWCQHNPGP